MQILTTDELDSQTINTLCPRDRAVVVYAASSPDIDPAYIDATRDLGRLLATGGYTLINGGGAGGLMGAVNDGCLDAGGRAIGIIPSFMHDKGWGHKNLTATIIANDMHDRKKTMAHLASVAVALPGGVGTLEEILEIITWQKLHLDAPKPIFLNIAGYYDPLLAMLNRAAEQHFMSATDNLYHVCQTTDQLIKQLKP